MECKLIETRSDYKQALARFKKIFLAEKGTKESNEANVLAVLIERYENEHFHVNAPDPIEAIKYRMEQQNLKQQDLAKYLGGKDKVSKVLNRKRKLTVEMIRNLHKFLHIPLDALVKKY